jgi:hypothetical protein
MLREDELRMTTADFMTAPPASPPLDPEQRVNYSLGLVLGVGEFQQEQFYHLERGRQHTRLLHGYGTACGLHVTTNGSQVFVSPGVAVDPRGRVIDVARAQCADLNQWLGVPQNVQAVTAAFGSPVGPATAYVVLCYRDCLTNKVPVPGAPCRSEDDTLAPSRITESFDLKFSAIRPPATEESAVLQFGALLRRIQITSAAGPGTLLNVAQMEQLVRALEPMASPIGSPLGSPLSLSAGPLLLHPQDADAVFRAAFRVWITEVRPTLLPTGCGTPDEDCVVLAQLTFSVTRAGVVDPVPPPAINVHDADRPFLLPTRLLQEWLFETPAESGLALGSPLGSPATPLVVPTLNGDVAGPPGLNTVQRIRNIAVDPTVPLRLNDVLMGIPDGAGGVRWGLPPSGPYSTVAAGDLPIGSAPPIGSVYGGLAAAVQAPPGSGQVLLTFPGFVTGTRYVVKSLPSLVGVVPTPPPAVVPVVAFLGQTPTGLLLSVVDARLGTPVAAAFLTSMRLIVEISQFTVRP